MAASPGQQHSSERGNVKAAARLPLKIAEGARRDAQDPTSPPGRPNSSRPLYSPGAGPSPGGKMYSPMGHAVKRHDGMPFPPEDTMSFAPSEDSFLEREFMSTMNRVSPRMHMYSSHQPSLTVFPVPPHLQFVEDWRNAAHNVPPPMEELDPSLPSPRYSLEPYALHPAGSHHSSGSVEVETREEFPMYQLDLLQPLPSGGKGKSASKSLFSKVKKGLGLTPRKLTSGKGLVLGAGKKAEVSEAEVKQLLEGGIALELRYDSATQPMEKTRSEHDEMSLSSEGGNSPLQPETKAPEVPKPVTPRVVVPKLPLKVVASDFTGVDAVKELASAVATAAGDAPALTERLSESANPVGTHRTQLAPVSHRSHDEPYKPSARSRPSQVAMVEKIPKTATLAIPAASGQSGFGTNSVREVPRVDAQAPQSFSLNRLKAVRETSNNGSQERAQPPDSHSQAASSPALVTPPRPAVQNQQSGPFSPAGSSIASKKRADPNGMGANVDANDTRKSHLQPSSPVPVSPVKMSPLPMITPPSPEAGRSSVAHGAPGLNPPPTKTSPIASSSSRAPTTPPPATTPSLPRKLAVHKSTAEGRSMESPGTPILHPKRPPTYATSQLSSPPTKEPRHEPQHCEQGPQAERWYGVVPVAGGGGASLPDHSLHSRRPPSQSGYASSAPLSTNREARTAPVPPAQRVEPARAGDVGKKDMKKLEDGSPVRVMEPQKTPPISPAQEAPHKYSQPIHSHSPHYTHVFETPGPAVSDMSSQPSTPGTSLSSTKRTQISKQLQWHHNSRAPFQKTPTSQHHTAPRDLPDASTQSQASLQAEAHSGGSCSVHRTKGKTSKSSSRQQSPTKRRTSVTSDPSNAPGFQVNQVGASSKIPVNIATSLKQKAAGLLQKQDGSVCLSLGMGLAIGAGVGVVVGLVSGLGFVLSKRLSEKHSKEKDRGMPHLQRMEQSLIWALSSIPKVPVGGHTDSRKSDHNGRSDRDKSRYTRNSH